MPIQVTCNSCSSRLKAPDEAAGRKLKCPKCGAPITLAENMAVRKGQEVEQEIVVEEQDPFAEIGEQQEEEGVSHRSRHRGSSPVTLLAVLGTVLVCVPATAGLVWWSLRNSPEDLTQRLAEAPTASKTSVVNSNKPGETRPVENNPPREHGGEETKKAKLAEASKLKVPEPPAPDPAKQQRTKLLADIEAKRKEMLTTAEAEQKQNEMAQEQLRQKEAILRANPRFGDLFDKQAVAQYNAFQREARALAAKVQNSKEEWEQKWIDLEQEQRRILLEFPEPGDPSFTKYRNRLFTAQELEQFKAYEQDHSTPSAAANAYVKVLESKSILARTTYAGLFKNPNAEDSYAVCYNTPPVSGVAQPVHVYLYKDKAGYWQVSPVSLDGVHVIRGGPPTGYTRAKEPEPANPEAPKVNAPKRDPLKGL